jgi:hypothetical protein
LRARIEEDPEARAIVVAGAVVAVVVVRLEGPAAQRRDPVVVDPAVVAAEQEDLLCIGEATDDVVEAAGPIGARAHEVLDLVEIRRIQRQSKRRVGFARAVLAGVLQVLPRAASSERRSTLVAAEQEDPSQRGVLGQLDLLAS